MIENKQLFNRMASEWIKEYMYLQKEFDTMDILNAMPLKHLGIDFSDPKVGDSQRAEVFQLVEGLIPLYAPNYGYDRKANGKWAQANESTIIPLDVEEDQDLGMVKPFDNFVLKMRALLGADPDVTIVSDEQTKTINICVAGCNKPTAYRTFFQGEREIKGIGKVTILVNNHNKTYKTTSDLGVLKTMLAGHPLVKSIETSRFEDGAINRIFVIFKNTTVQFKNDNFGSPFSVTTTTAEALAKEVMKDSGLIVLWTTDSEFPREKWIPENNIK